MVIKRAQLKITDIRTGNRIVVEMIHIKSKQNQSRCYCCFVVDDDDDDDDGDDGDEYNDDVGCGGGDDDCVDDDGGSKHSTALFQLYSVHNTESTQDGPHIQEGCKLKICTYPPVQSSLHLNTG